MLIEDKCSLSYFLLSDHFSELSLLHKTIEDLIAGEESREIDHLANFASALPAEKRSEYWADNHPYWWEHIIAPQFRSSFYISLMAGVELHLGRLAQDAATIVRAPIGPDDLKGEFYPRTRRFLALFCNFEGPSERAWERINDFYAIRNCLVHAGGHLDDRRRSRRVRTLASHVEGLTVTPNDQIEMEREFCHFALQECKRFLDEVWRRLGLLCERVR